MKGNEQQRENLPARGQLHIWRFRLDISFDTSVVLRKTLSGEDRHKVDRLVTSRLQKRATASRGTLRHLLGQYLDQDAGAIELMTGAQGKPHLAPESGRALSFNLSHTADEGILAVASEGTLGIDLERIRPEIDIERLSRRVFSPIEQDSFSAIPSDQRRISFFHVWTCKEAFLKAHGGGLTVPLNAFDVEVDPDQEAKLIETRLPGDERAGWHLKVIDVEEGLRSAIAYNGRSPLENIERFRLEESALVNRH